MFETLEKINKKPRVWECYTAQTLWDDDHISKQMLSYHLNPDLALASRTPEMIQKSVDWMAGRFGVGEDTRVADFGCGPGLYATRFAQKGAKVTGVDFSRNSIAYAKEQAPRQGLSIDYVCENYLDYEPGSQFDLIVLIFCDLCPLSPDQRAALLAKFRDSLADGGRLFLDVFSVAAFDQRKEEASYGRRVMDGFWAKGDYFAFQNTFKYEEEKVLLEKYVIYEPSRSWEVYNWLQAYTLESLCQELAQSGLEVTESFSDASGAPYSATAPEIAVVVKKVG